MYWFFSNLQHLVERAVVGAATGDLPADIHASFKPFPWPAVKIDLGLLPSSSQCLTVIISTCGFYLDIDGRYPHILNDCICVGLSTLSCSAIPDSSLMLSLRAGAGAAALAFNLLLVYAFLAPTRSVVAGIVREKELRLREGMRILGLKVLLNLAAMIFSASVCDDCVSINPQPPCSAVLGRIMNSQEMRVVRAE